MMKKGFGAGGGIEDVASCVCVPNKGMDRDETCICIMGIFWSIHNRSEKEAVVRDELR
jgi:hypothetical protein